jgi:hypothetical protein
VPSSSIEGWAALAVRPGLVSELVSRIGGTVMSRVPVREWSMSSVSRVYLTAGGSVILKCAADVFSAEPAALAHAATHGVPVPQLLAKKILDDGSMAMLIEDLGEPTREAGAADAVKAAVAVHACPPRAEAAVLNSAGLMELPVRALHWLKRLQDEGRWLNADDLQIALEQIVAMAERRARDADIPPFGTCHSEFHPTSIHIGSHGTRILDWARSYTGPGLLDLISWQGTVEPVDLRKVSDLIDAYVAAGGPAEATAERGGLSAHVWAAGWDKLWVAEWFMQQAARWQSPADDAVTQQAVRRHLREVVVCLT